MKTRETAAAKTMNTEPMTLAFEVTVTSVQELSPNFRRITFGGYSLRDFGVHGDTLDLRIKLMIPSLAADGSPLPLPVFEMSQSGWYREWLAMDIGAGLEDAVIENGGPIRDTALRVLAVAGWLPR